MVNEEILTALKNAIDRGESLQSAINVLINSGYNQKEVQEASNFVGRGVISYFEPKPGEQLAMPSEKIVPKPTRQFQSPGSFETESSLIKQGISSEQYPEQYYRRYSDKTFSSDFDSSKSLSRQLETIAPPRKSYAFEIFLLIILLILIGFLISTILFKQKIIEFFSGFI